VKTVVSSTTDRTKRVVLKIGRHNLLQTG